MSTVWAALSQSKEPLPTPEPEPDPPALRPRSAPVRWRRNWVVKTAWDRACDYVLRTTMTDETPSDWSQREYLFFKNMFHALTHATVRQATELALLYPDFVTAVDLYWRRGPEAVRESMSDGGVAESLG